MTVILARRFGDRILIISDTMISGRALAHRANPAEERSDYRSAIPGRLKTIILDAGLSIGYAGVADGALDQVRKFNFLRLSGSLEYALEYLRRETIPAVGCVSGSSDFVLAFHSPHAELLQVADGQIKRNLQHAVIGVVALEGVVRAKEAVLSKNPHFKKMYLDEDVTISREEVIFSAAVNQVFSDRGVLVREAVGGFPIQLLASPFGHKYLYGASAEAFGEISQHARARPLPNAGMTGWKYNVVSSVMRGVPILGVLVPQAQTAFVYTPLHADDPERISMRDRYPDYYLDTSYSERRMLERLVILVDKRANEIGGGFVVED